MVHAKSRLHSALRKWLNKHLPGSGACSPSRANSYDTMTTGELSRSISRFSSGSDSSNEEAKQDPPESVPLAFPFTGLPLELQLEIIEILKTDTEADHSNPLKSLRLTSKHLNRICRPSMFYHLDLTVVDIPRLQQIVASVDDFAPHIRSLELWITDPTIDEPDGDNSLAAAWEFGLVNLLHRTVGLQSLTLHHARDDKRGRHTLLLHAISGLPNLRHVTIQEHNFSPVLDAPYGDVCQEEASRLFFHELLMTLFLSHGQRLESLRLFTLLPLHSTAFTRLRDHVPNLHTLHFSTNISLSIRSKFEDDKRWASAGNLKNLTLHECGGTHVINIGNHVLKGNFGNLQVLNIIACGDPTDDIPSRSDLDELTSESTYRFKCQVPTLEYLHIDHASDWELHALACIPTSKLAITRAPVETILTLENLLQAGAGFGRTMKELSVFDAPLMHASEAQNLFDTCTSKSIAVNQDAKCWGYCQCHPDA